MTVEELEQILEARSESPSLDFKASCPWNVITYAKDLLAIVNLVNGGLIVVGVEDGSFQRKGVTPEHRDTYKVETMRDQMTRYADPHVLFDCEVATDRGGLEYVVIQVHPFREIPVICRESHQGAGLQAGTIYYRNSNRRPESAPVSNSYDMRSIVLAAVARTRASLETLGFRVPVSDEDRYNAELGKDLTL